jgi:uncharacterized protein involved in exopolysaccharide biosynthesis
MERVMTTSETESVQQAKPQSGRQLSPEVVAILLWRRRFLLLLITVLFAGIGIVVALLTTPEYVSEARVMPEMSQGSGDMFRKLASAAGFAGIDFGEAEGVDAVRPDLYPNVLQSTPFILYLLAQSAPTKEGSRKTVSAILLKYSEKKWFAFNRKQDTLLAVRNPESIQLTEEQQDLLEEVQQRVSAKMDTRSGIITITARLPDPVAVAAVAELAMDYLTHYVTDYRTEKVRRDLRFYTDRLNEAKKRFQTAQYNVFHYNDQHKYMIVEAATMNKKQLETELAISEKVYSELAKQQEQVKIKVQERTPVFKVLEPTKIPLKRVSPKRTLMVLFYALVGFMIGSLYLLVNGFGALETIRRRIQAAELL